MGVDRRKFLKIAGISALGVAAKPAASVFAKDMGSFTPSETILHLFDKPLGFAPGEALTATRWAMVVNVKAVDEEIANACQAACHKIHNVPDIENPKHEIKWIWSDNYENVFTDQEHELIMDDLKELPFLALCNHCYDPPCVRVCPTKATFKRETDGIVVMDMHRCIGCRFCMAACPYGSRSFNWVDPREYINEEEQNMDYPTRMKGVVEKCNFCAELLAEGRIPRCVEVAQEISREKGKEPALVFGDLDDPDSEVRKLLRSRYSLRRKPTLGTNPNVYYIV